MNQNNDDISRPEMDYYLNEDLCDVVFEVEGQRIPAPKQLLSMKSRVFRAMFSGNFNESEEKVIPIKDTTVVVFKELIRFLISDQTVLPTNKDYNQFEFIGQLLRLSDRYEVLRLSVKIINTIKRLLNVKNLRSFTRIAVKYNIKELMIIVIEFIENNINEVIHRDIEELSEINDYTNNGLFDVMTSSRVRRDRRLITFKIEGKELFLTKTIYDSNDLHRLVYYEINGSFEALKVLIGFLYFKRLIIKNKNDFKPIREVCEMAERYPINGLMDEISADLQNRITYENMKPILRIIFDFKFNDLKENLFKFIETNIEDLVKSCVEEFSQITEEMDTEVGHQFTTRHHKTTILKSSDFELIRHILCVITRYENSDLMDRVTALLKDCLTFDNIPYIYELAISSGNEELITNIETFVDNNIRDICRQKRDDLFGINQYMNGLILESIAKHLANN